MKSGDDFFAAGYLVDDEVRPEYEARWSGESGRNRKGRLSKNMLVIPGSGPIALIAALCHLLLILFVVSSNASDYPDGYVAEGEDHASQCSRQMPCTSAYARSFMQDLPQEGRLPYWGESAEQALEAIETAGQREVK